MNLHPLRVRRHGFTLIEFSIVLVIIALLVAGILVGRELIAVATLRATVSQVQEYRQAMESFRLKYGNLPGDVPTQRAASFGFYTLDLDGTEGRRDGNGLIQSAGLTDRGASVISGELAQFWRDLQKAGMIKDKFLEADAPYYSTASADWFDVLPRSKIGRGAVVYVWSGDNTNYFGIAVPTWLNTMFFHSHSAFTPEEASSIDGKMDDNNPQQGSVTVAVIDYGRVWSSGFLNGVSILGGAGPGNAIAPHYVWCYDNDNNAANPMKYSTVPGGETYKCSLSFALR